MKIAVIAPTVVGQVEGGLERLVAGLVRASDARDGIDAELVTQPVREDSFFSLVAAYRSFFELDVRAFDVVVTCKYPAWMVRHPRHVCYMAHRLRGLYDTYHLFRMPTEIEAGAAPAVSRLLSFLDHAEGSEGCVTELFERVDELASAAPDLDPSLFAFPGPLVRRIVHFLDDAALAPQAVSRYMAISDTVAHREGYFPPGADVHVVHPPTPMEGLAPSAEGTGFLAPGRFDGPKRIDLAIEGFLQADLDLPLAVAGDGPERERLAALAGDDPRIRFLGRIDDRGLAQAYRNAQAVVFPPLDEDYGLVTVEAMRCGKPVLTCSDSGGPLELVQNGRTGLVVEPTPEGVAAGLRALADPARARTMGEQALVSVEGVTWDAVIDAIVAPPEARPSYTFPVDDADVVITAVSTYPIDPPNGGGKALLFDRYGALPDEISTTFVSLVRPVDHWGHSTIAPGVAEAKVRKSARHQVLEEELTVSLGGTPATDVAALLFWDESPALVREVERAAARSHVLTACQPYLYPLLRRVRRDHVLVYDAQNVEFHLKSEIIGRLSPMARACVDLTREYERQLVAESDLVVVYTDEDAQDFRALYGLSDDRLLISRPGFDLEAIPFVGVTGRPARRRELGLGDGPLALFVGSFHGPNNEAGHFLLDLAEALPAVTFVLAGSHTWSLAPHSAPANVVRLGLVDSDALAELLHLADVALNPVVSGSGINLKVGQCLAAGVPLLTTEFGVRGYPLDAEEAVFVARRDEFAERLVEVLDDEPRREQAAIRARRFVEREFDRRVVVTAFVDRLRALAAGRQGERVLDGSGQAKSA